jgi:protein-tyrosine phosphatase
MMAQMHGIAEDAGETRCTVLLVCTGNICRSAMAEVALRDELTRRALADGRVLDDVVDVQSAGTSSWHAGEPMDPRARAALDRAGLTGDGSDAAQVTRAQLQRAALVVALDHGHRAELRALAPDVEITLLRWWAEGDDLDVADPYYADDEAFDACLARIVPGCRALADALAARLGSAGS